jgi:Leucine-rich repeat (LRR) protein
VADVLETADLSDDALYDVDLEPSRLFEKIDALNKSQPIRAGLSTEATELYNLALRSSCITLVHLIRELPEFAPMTAIESLKRLGSIAEKLDAITESISLGTIDAPTGTRLDDDFYRRYLTAVRKNYDSLDIIGLTTHSFDARTTLSVAYLSLTVTAEGILHSRKIHGGTESTWIDTYSHEARLSENIHIEAALGRGPRTIIRGDAGAGKSTLLRWIAINAASSSFEAQLAEWNGLAPFLVKLREFSDRPLPRVEDMTNQPSSPSCGPVPPGWIHRQFMTGRAILLVDGVDELVQRQREAVRVWLSKILETYPDIRVVVTSRPTAITSRFLKREQFNYVTLEPMTPGDIREFLHRWHQALLTSTPDSALLPCPPDEIPNYERTLLAQMQARGHLRNLARSPLLCAMLCALNLDRRGQLPRERQSLYLSALDMLLERRDVQRNVASAEVVQLTKSEKQALLRELAWWLNTNSRAQMTWSQALLQVQIRLLGMPNVDIDAETALTYLIERSGVIRRPTMDSVDFAHRTFQEYLSAQEAIDRDSISLLVNHARSDLWRETILMACAQASYDQRGQLLRGIVDSAKKASGRASRQLTLLAASCLETAVEAPPETITRVRQNLASLLPPRGSAESQSLSTVGEPILDQLPSTLGDLNRLSEAQASACVRIAILVNGSKALKLLELYTQDNRPEVQREIMEGWLYFEPDRYARQVLANCDLIEGRLSIRHHRLVPYADRVTNARSLDIDLTSLYISSLSFLNKAENVERLSVICSGAIDLMPLMKHLQLKTLTFQGGFTFKNIRSLDNMVNLEALFARSYPISHDTPLFDNIDFLQEMHQLKKISLGTLKDNLNFDVFSNMHRLIDLNIEGCIGIRVRDLQLPNPSVLKALGLSGARNPRLAGFVADYFRNLKQLSLEDNSIRDITPLSTLHLNHLSLSGSPVRSLAPVAHMRTLRSLWIDRCANIHDLTPLIRLNLRELDLTHNQEYQGLSSLPASTKVRFFQTST